MFLLVLAKLGNTALLLAAFGGSVPLVRMLLEDYASTLDEVDEVSVTCSVEVLRFIMIHFLYMHKRVVLSTTYPTDITCCLYILHSCTLGMKQVIRSRADTQSVVLACPLQIGTTKRASNMHMLLSNAHACIYSGD